MVFKAIRESISMSRFESGHPLQVLLCLAWLSLAFVYLSKKLTVKKPTVMWAFFVLYNLCKLYIYAMTMRLIS